MLHLKALFFYFLIFPISISTKYYKDDQINFQYTEKFKNQDKKLNFIIKANALGQIYFTENKKIENVLFEFGENYEISGKFGTNLTVNSSSILSKNEIFTDLSNTDLLLNIKFWPKLYNNLLYQIELLPNDKLNYDKKFKKKLPWELNLIFTVSENNLKNGVNFFLKEYSLLTQYNIFKNNMPKKINKKYTPDKFIRKWDSEDKIGFMCYESSLNFNTSESSKQQYGIIFKNIQITTALSDNDNKTIESLNHSDDYKTCKINKKNWFEWTKFFNIDYRFFVLITIIVIISILLRKRVVHNLKTSGNYNITTLPFSLEEMDDETDDIFFKNKNKKNKLPQGIY